MMTPFDPYIAGTMIACFVVYLLGVRVLEFLSARLRSITFIKSIHTIVFVPLSALLLIFAYQVVTGNITILTWIAIAVFLAETVVLIANNWRCPLTGYAERLGSAHGQITDFFFPKWFADRVFIVYGAVFVLSLMSLAIRLIV